MAQLADTLAREGVISLGRRQIARVAGACAERSRIARAARRPWRADGRPVFLLLSHACGGGTARHLNDLAAALASENVRPVLVRPSKARRLLWEEFAERASKPWCAESLDQRESIFAQLATLRPVHAHVHHLMGLPDFLLELLSEHGVTYDWTIHDYHAICPRVHLIGAGGTYCGEPDAGSCNRCLALLGDDQGHPVKQTITSWRGTFARRLGGARRIFVPSDDVRRRIARYFPELPVLLRPHPEALPPRESLAAPIRPGETVRVAVLGTIVSTKGSLRLLACARDARSRRLPLEFHVIGSTDRDAVFARAGNVRVTGRYPEGEVYDRLAGARCHLAFLPSLCPESFMYTLSIVMAARFFVVCFDLGAQAERLRAWGWGQTLPWAASAESINDSLLAIARSLVGAPPAPPPPPGAFYPELLTSYYDFTPQELAGFFRSGSAETPRAKTGTQAVRRIDLAHLY
jgi:glycosyltransferase involved in cell wall biosynthesis